MIDKEHQLDEALVALFADMDVTAEFEAGVLLRLGADSQAEFTEGVMGARQREHARYRLARSELQRVLRSSLRTVVLDGFGIGYFLVLGALAVWPHWDSQIAPLLADHYLLITALLGILIALVPLVAARTRAVSVSA